MTTVEKLKLLCKLQIPEPFCTLAIENLEDAYKIGMLEGQEIAIIEMQKTLFPVETVVFNKDENN